MEDQKNVPLSSFTSVFLRLYWMMAGNVAFVILSIYLLLNYSTISFIVDVFFWLSALSLVITRYIDIRYFHGQTTENEPATMGHWKRYAIGVGVLSVIVWTIAHLLGKLFH